MANDVLEKSFHLASLNVSVINEQNAAFVVMHLDDLSAVVN